MFVWSRELVFTSRDVVVYDYRDYDVNMVPRRRLLLAIVIISRFLVTNVQIARNKLLKPSVKFYSSMLRKKITKCCLYQFVAHSCHCLCWPPFSSQLVNSRCKNFLEITSRVYNFRRVFGRNPCRKHGKHEFVHETKRIQHYL